MQLFVDLAGCALIAGALFLVVGIVRAVKKKSKKSIIISFSLVVVFAAAAIVFNGFANAYQSYNSALYEIQRTHPLEYSLESAMNDFEKAGAIKDSAESKDLIYAFFNEDDPDAFHDEAEDYFSNPGCSITKQDLYRHIYYILANSDEIPAQTASEYYGMFLRDYAEDMSGSDTEPENPFECIADADGSWLSECGKSPDGKAAVYIRYSDEDLAVLDDDLRRNGISLRYSYLLGDSLALSPGEAEYLIIADYELLYKGVFARNGGSNITAYKQSVKVGVYTAADLELIKDIGAAYGSDVSDSIAFPKDYEGSDYIAGDIDAGDIEDLIKQAIDFIETEVAG